jgi:uncharacterized membrane protein
MDDIVFARALHVLAVVHWIGGVAFARLVVLPLARSRPAAEGLTPFTALEQRFASQVRISIPLAGATGLWMTYRMNLWDRFADPRFWWMSAMFGIWLVFMLMVFVFDPLLHARFERQARRDPLSTLRRVADLHAALLALAAITVLGAVAGAQGLSFF